MQHACPLQRRHRREGIAYEVLGFQNQVFVNTPLVMWLTHNPQVFVNTTNYQESIVNAFLSAWAVSMRR